VAVVLYLVDIDVTGRYNCQVRAIHIYFLCAHDLIGRDPKVETIFVMVSKGPLTDVFNLSLREECLAF
jgi:hypothetical protein